MRAYPGAGLYLTDFAFRGVDGLRTYPKHLALSDRARLIAPTERVGPLRHPGYILPAHGCVFRTQAVLVAGGFRPLLSPLSPDGCSTISAAHRRRWWPVREIAGMERLAAFSTHSSSRHGAFPWHGSTPQGRVPRVRRRHGRYVIECAATKRLERHIMGKNLDDPMVQQDLSERFEKLGFHRALRVAGARPGSAIETRMSRAS